MLEKFDTRKSDAKKKPKLPTDPWKGPLPTDPWKKPLPLDPWKDKPNK